MCDKFLTKSNVKKVLFVTVMLIALVLPLSAEANVAKDKVQHAEVGAVLNLGLQSVGVKKETAWCITGAILVGKELYDYRHRDRHSPEFADIGAGVVGVIASEGVIWIVKRTW